MPRVLTDSSLELLRIDRADQPQCYVGSTGHSTGPHDHLERDLDNEPAIALRVPHAHQKRPGPWMPPARWRARGLASLGEGRAHLPSGGMSEFFGLSSC